MGSTTFDVNIDVKECFRRAQQILGDAGFEITNIVPDRTIMAKKGRF
jgi:hypothetical protein